MEVGDFGNRKRKLETKSKHKKEVSIFYNNKNE